eukprot:TRINITY_DN33649_c0_g1_i2.p1 TRINITY_DN33649_c0_g1~~TRINITY_DN33649_c0_g1_i2.p1  ORF type:complete len:253 (+),score=71.19 TRINITY_DN33649_c0_g1_i2:90-761(+)
MQPPGGERSFTLQRFGGRLGLGLGLDLTITEVCAGSPGAAAGLPLGARIAAVGSVRCATQPELGALLRAAPCGEDLLLWASPPPGGWPASQGEEDEYDPCAATVDVSGIAPRPAAAAPAGEDALSALLQEAKRPLAAASEPAPAQGGDREGSVPSSYASDPGDEEEDWTAAPPPKRPRGDASELPDVQEESAASREQQVRVDDQVAQVNFGARSLLERLGVPK